MKNVKIYREYTSLKKAIKGAYKLEITKLAYQEMYKIKYFNKDLFLEKILLTENLQLSNIVEVINDNTYLDLNLKS